MEDDKVIKANKYAKLKLLLLGLVLGVVLILGLRFITYMPPKDTHYHANFAVYVDGQREKFENPFYYEEVTSCNLEAKNEPEHRVHMHNKANDVIHVHDGAVSWGNLFQNIGWNISKDYIDTSEKLLVNDSHKKMSFVLNGEPISDITGKVIGDKDKLLVSYGTESSDDLKQQFGSISSSAKEFDNNQDPASCSGNHKETTIKDRLKNLL